VGEIDGPANVAGFGKLGGFAAYLHLYCGYLVAFGTRMQHNELHTLAEERVIQPH
jgi:hypothetical protein